MEILYSLGGLAAGLGVLLLPLYAAWHLIACLRHRLPDISVAWAMKSRLAACNFTPRGQEHRRRGVEGLLIWLLLVVAILVRGCLVRPPASQPIGRAAHAARPDEARAFVALSSIPHSEFLILH